MSYMGRFIEIKARQYCMFVEAVFFRFVSCTMFSYVRIVFIYCFLDSNLLEEISVKKRALHRTIWSQIPCSSLSLFPWLSLSLSFILHLFHLPPACQNLHNWTSICHFSCMLFPLPHLPYSPALILPMQRPTTTLPVCLIKMKPFAEIKYVRKIS